MIQSHISSITNCEVVLKLERFFHLSGQSFGLNSSIGLGYLPIIGAFSKSRCTARKGYLNGGYIVPQERSGVEAI